MPDQATASIPTCICKHSHTAHTIGKGKGCSFCSCESFRQPDDVPPPAHEPLSEQAEKALELLSHHPEFKHVQASHLDEIARWGRRRLYMVDQILMDQGEPSTCLHIMVKGTVKVERSVAGQRQPLRLAELGPGDIIGEIGMLRGDPRSARITALADVETLEIDAEPLKKVFRNDPDVLIAIMKVANERLKSTDDMVEQSLQVALTQLSSEKK